MLKKHFAENTSLGKEQRLYQLLIEESTGDSIKAESLLDVVIENHKKLTQKDLVSARYDLVKDIKESYPINDLFRSKIRNYKTYASIYKLFESHNPLVYCDPKEIFESKNTILKSLCSRGSEKNEVADVNKYEKQNEDLRLIAYKLLVDNFNKKYSSLDDSQQKLLKNYINNISNTNSLREYINKQVPSIKNQINKFSKYVDDDVVKIKLKEVISQLDKTTEGKVVRDSQVSTVLMSYELIKELKRHADEKSDLRTLIQKVISELQDEDKDIFEINTTGNIEGYQTPHAFSPNSEKQHKKNIKSTVEVFDYKETDNKKTNTVKLQEGKSLFHVFRDHPDLTPEQKMGVAIREVNKLLTEVEKIMKVTTRYKNEANIGSGAMWKTTNRYISKLEEKLGKISLKLKEMK